MTHVQEFEKMQTKHYEKLNKGRKDNVYRKQLINKYKQYNEQMNIRLEIYNNKRGYKKLTREEKDKYKLDKFYEEQLELFQDLTNKKNYRKTSFPKFTDKQLEKINTSQIEAIVQHQANFLDNPKSRQNRFEQLEKSESWNTFKRRNPDIDIKTYDRLLDIFNDDVYKKLKELVMIDSDQVVELFSNKKHNDKAIANILDEYIEIVNKIPKTHYLNRNARGKLMFALATRNPNEDNATTLKKLGLDYIKHNKNYERREPSELKKIPRIKSSRKPR